MKVQDRFEKFTIPIPECGCWIWMGNQSPKGYGLFWLNRKFERANRVSWMIYHGEIPRGLLVCHTCDTPGCVNPHHLFLGTNKDNMDDCTIKDRRPRGMTHHKTTISDDIAKEIKKSGNSSRVLARQYGVAKSTILRIKHGATWGHIV